MLSIMSTVSVFVESSYDWGAPDLGRLFLGLFDQSSALVLEVEGWSAVVVWFILWILWANLVLLQVTIFVWLLRGTLSIVLFFVSGSNWALFGLLNWVVSFCRAIDGWLRGFHQFLILYRGLVSPRALFLYFVTSPIWAPGLCFEWVLWLLALPSAPLTLFVDQAVVPSNPWFRWWYCVPVGWWSQPSDGSLVAVKPVPVTAYTYARLRRRSRWVKQLETVLGDLGSVSDLVKGRWTPDLPCREYSDELNMLLTHRGEGVMLLGGGKLATEKDGPVSYYVVMTPDDRVDVVCPQLIASLASYSCFRSRDATLVTALRSRALEKCKKWGLSDSHTNLLLPSAVSWAWRPSPREAVNAESVVDAYLPNWWG